MKRNVKKSLPVDIVKTANEKDRKANANPENTRAIFLSGLKSLCDGYVMEQGFGIANMLKL